MKKKFNGNIFLTNIKYKWFLVLTAAILIFTAANVFFLKSYSVNHEANKISQVKYSIAETVNQKSDAHKRFLENRIIMLKLAASQIISYDNIFSTESIEYLSSASEIAGFDNISLINTNGNLFDKDSLENPRNVSTREYFIDAMKGNSHTSELLVSGPTGTKGIVLSTPIYKNETIIGVMATLLNIEYLTSNFAQDVFGGHGHCLLFDKNNTLITNNEIDNINEIAALINYENKVVTITDKTSKEQSYCAYSRIGNTGITLVSVVSDDILKDYVHIDNRNILVFTLEIIISYVLLMAVVVLVIYKLNSQKIKESLKFETAIKQISRYNFEYSPRSKKLIFSKDAADFLQLPLIINNPFMHESLQEQIAKNHIKEKFKKLTEHTNYYKFETVFHINNEPHNLLTSISSIKNKNGDVSIIGTFEDISTDKQMLNQLYKKINYDTLTGLYSRDCIIRKISNILESNKNAQHGFFILDLDGFKQINDSYGHNVGDEVLIKVGNCIKQTVRAHDLVSRLGGDEFIVFLPHVKNNEHLFNIAMQIYENLIGLTINDDIQQTISCAIGISISNSLSTYDDLYKNADIALQAVKKSDSNVSFYEGSTSETEKKNESVEDKSITSSKINAVQQDLLIKLSKDPDYVKSTLLKAMENDEFEIYLQPKFNTKTKIVDAAEALARWNSPKYGFVTPLNFINLLERTNLIVLFDTMILEKAIKQLSKWKELGYNINLSVNQSSHLLTNANYVKSIVNMLQDNNVNGSSLTIEITERSALTTYRTITKVAEQLRKLGVKFSIDDFGSGNTTLNMLKSIKVDEIKLDRLFMLNTAENKERANVITKNIIRMATDLNILTVSEGVETAEQAEILTKFGCSYLQGYYYSKPISVSTFENRYLKK